MLFVIGLLVLVVGAETLVRGAKRLGALAGLSPLVVGLTIVSFATTAPEATVSIVAAASGRGGLAIGNVLGSNIFNILVVVGVAAVIGGLPVTLRTVRQDIPVLIAATGTTFLFSLDGRLRVWEGVVLLGGLASYVAFTIYQSRREALGGPGSPRRPNRRGAALFDLAVGLTIVVVGAGMLVVGSRLFVDSASGIARSIGVSELVIGLTLVAAGTSAPELTTSVVAAVRKETDVAVGNAIGASIINLLWITGMATVIGRPALPVPDPAVRFDFPIATAVALATLPLAFTGSRIRRWEGAFLLLFYLSYVLVLILDAFDRKAVEPVSSIVLAYVIPLVGLTALAVAWRIYRPERWRHRRGRVRR